MRVCSGEVEETVECELVPGGSRLANLLGAMRREKNGAVADYMRFYGAKYGLNYGVSLPTIREIARADAIGADEVSNHKFAKQLYKQQVRELRLAAFYLADIKVISSADELAFWAKGIINSEIAEEAAFALFYQSEDVDVWLESDNALLQYCAIMALAKRCESGVDVAREVLLTHSDRMVELVHTEPHITPKAVVALLDVALRSGVETALIVGLISSLGEGSSAKFVRDEMAWRLE